MAFAIGILGAAPLLLGLGWALRTQVRSVRRLLDLVVDQLGPLLVSCSRVELALLAALAGFAEEVLFRAVVQTGLTRVLPLWGSLVVASTAFGVAHFVTPTYALLAGVAGLYLGCLFLFLGSLTIPIIAHTVYDIVALNCVVRLYLNRRTAGDSQ